MAELSPEEWVARLDGKLLHYRPKLKLRNAYLTGRQPIRYMAPALEREFGNRLTQLVINWPRLATEVYEHRLDVEGFRYPGAPTGDETLWNVWQANGLDEASQLAHYEAIGLGWAYAITGPGEGKYPLITVEHPLQVVTEADPRTRKPLRGLKKWVDLDQSIWTTLYGPNDTRFYRQENGKWAEQTKMRIEHSWGMVPVTPIVNRPRMLSPIGLSEFADIIPLANAANKMATDMMVSGEYHATPRRWALGISQDDFVDENGDPLDTWEQVTGRVWSTEKGPGEAAVGQFPEADLSVFHNTIKMLAQLASQILGLPPHYMQFAGDQPASADAIRSSEAQLVKRAERKQRVFGASWEQVMRLALRVMGEETEESDRLEAIWRDASTPTVAQAADAAIKLYTAPPGQKPILTLSAVRRRLGIPDGEIRDMEAEEEAAERRDPLRQFMNRNPVPDEPPVSG